MGYRSRIPLFSLTMSHSPSKSHRCFLLLAQILIEMLICFIASIECCHFISRIDNITCTFSSKIVFFLFHHRPTKNDEELNLMLNCIRCFYCVKVLLKFLISTLPSYLLFSSNCYCSVNLYQAFTLSFPKKKTK